MFNVQCSMFNVQCSGVQCSMARLPHTPTHREASPEALARQSHHRALQLLRQRAHTRAAHLKRSTHRSANIILHANILQRIRDRLDTLQHDAPPSSSAAPGSAGVSPAGLASASHIQQANNPHIAPAAPATSDFTQQPDSSQPPAQTSSSTPAALVIIANSSLFITVLRFLGFKVFRFLGFKVLRF